MARKKKKKKILCSTGGKKKGKKVWKEINMEREKKNYSI